MRSLIEFFLLLPALLVSANAFAADVSVENAWARATAPGQDVAMVDLSVTSPAAAKLVGVSSSVCSSVELHLMTHEDGMMKMRQVDAIKLDAGKAVNLSAAGYHLMLIGLKAPLKQGEHIPLTLTINHDGGHVEKVNVNAEVRGLTDTGKTSHEHHH